MSKTKHTPEPWSVNHWHNNGTNGVTCHGDSSDGISFFTGDAVKCDHFNIVAKIDHQNHDVQGSFEGAHIAEILCFSDQSKANALRIVACVNAMAGIDNPDEYMQGVKLLEKRYYQEQEDKATYRRQRDQLYRMCEELWQNLNGFNIDPANFCEEVAQVLKDNNPSTVVDPDQIHKLQPLNHQS